MPDYFETWLLMKRAMDMEREREREKQREKDYDFRAKTDDHFLKNYQKKGHFCLTRSVNDSLHLQTQSALAMLLF